MIAKQMRFLTIRVAIIVFFLFVYAYLGLLARETATPFASLLAFLAILFVVGAFIMSIRNFVREDNKFFETESEDKIKYHMFFRRSVYIVPFIDFILIFIILSGTADRIPIIESILESVILALLMLVMLGISALIDETVPKNFNHNIYRASLGLANRSNSDKQSLHFLSALKYYDKYLRRKFGMAISNLEGIFSAFAQMQTKDKKLFLSSLLDSHEDSLAPLRVLVKINKPNTELLVSVSYLQKLKDTISFIIPVIAILITVIQLF